MLTRRSLELIRDHSTLNVRILTRSLIARRDFDIFQTFGDRLLLGMSVPTLDSRISKAYEPTAPAPHHRLETLIAARKAGINVFVALAPTYPECSRADLVRTLEAVKKLEPVTIYHEPVNVRLGNVEKIKAQAALEGVALQPEVFETKQKWARYALSQFHMVEEIARELHVHDRLTSGRIHRSDAGRSWKRRKNPKFTLRGSKTGGIASVNGPAQLFSEIATIGGSVNPHCTGARDSADFRLAPFP